jgi:hypothetical protein
MVGFWRCAIKTLRYQSCCQAPYFLGYLFIGKYFCASQLANYENFCGHGVGISRAAASLEGRKGKLEREPVNLIALPSR